MTEKQPDPNSEELHQLKDDLVATWEQLPPQHQATMALVLLQTVMEGELGEWLREAISLKWPSPTDE